MICKELYIFNYSYLIQVQLQLHVTLYKKIVSSYKKINNFYLIQVIFQQIYLTHSWDPNKYLSGAEWIWKNGNRPAVHTFPALQNWTIIISCNLSYPRLWGLLLLLCRGYSQYILCLLQIYVIVRGFLGISNWTHYSIQSAGKIDIWKMNWQGRISSKQSAYPICELNWCSKNWLWQTPEKFWCV